MDHTTAAAISEQQFTYDDYFSSYSANTVGVTEGLGHTVTVVDSALNISTVKGAQVQLMLYDYLVPTIGAIIIVLNLAVMISSGLLIKSGGQPKTTYLFLWNIAMADLITGIAVVMGQTYPKSMRNHTTCSIQLGMIISSTMASVWSVGLIAIDRFLYIGHGLKYQKWLSSRRATLLILGTWILGLVVGFLPAFGWSGDTKNGKICWFIRLPPGFVIMTTVLGLLPIALVLALYSIILYLAMKKVSQLQRADKEHSGDATRGGKQSENKTKELRVFRGGRNTEQSSKSKPKKSKAIKVVLFTTMSFVLTWMPYFIACSIYVTCPNENSCKPLKVAIAAPLAILGFFNSLINPVIYAWWHNGFRTFVRKNINQLRKFGREQNNDSSVKSQSTNTTSTKSNSSQGSRWRKTSEQIPLQSSGNSCKQ